VGMQQQQVGVNQAGVIQETVDDGVVQQRVQGDYRKADVDNPAAMHQIGAEERGQYAGTDTVGMIDNAGYNKSDSSMLGASHPYNTNTIGSPAGTTGMTGSTYGTSPTGMDNTYGTSTTGMGSPYNTNDTTPTGTATSTGRNYTTPSTPVV